MKIKHVATKATRTKGTTMTFETKDLELTRACPSSDAETQQALVFPTKDLRNAAADVLAEAFAYGDRGDGGRAC